MSTKHEKSYVDYDKAYEGNVVGLKGIIYFGIGLFLLIAVTFVLMFFLMNALEQQAAESKDTKENPMMTRGDDKLPPEPRLQVAPGFGVDSDKGRVDLSLHAPQSEYRELRKQWESLWKNGVKDAKSGTSTSLPIEEAKKRLIEQNPNANVQDSQRMMSDIRAIVSYSSSGRMASEHRK
jgi:hypothetical protein